MLNSTPDCVLEAGEKERDELLEALKHISRAAIARATGEQP